MTNYSLKPTDENALELLKTDPIQRKNMYNALPKYCPVWRMTAIRLP